MKRTALFLCAAVLFSLPGFAGAMTPQEFDDKALPLLDKPKEAAKLLQLCEEALKDTLDPAFEAFVRVVRGQAYFLQNEFAKAEAEARRVIASGHQPELGYALATQALFAMGDYDLGKKMCIEGANKESNEQRRARELQYCEALYNQEKALTAESLWQAYKNNPGAVEKKYSSKPLSVTGTVLAVDTAGAEGPQIILAVDGSKNKNIVCLFGSGGKKKPAVPADKKTEADDKPAPAASDEIAYSLDDAPEKPATETARPEKEPRPQIPGPAAMPEKGATVVITGAIRGMEGSQLVLINCTLAE